MYTIVFVGSVTEISVGYEGLARDVEAGKLLYLADGAIALRILSTTDDRIETRVEVGGELRGQQGSNYRTREALHRRTR